MSEGVTLATKNGRHEKPYESKSVTASELAVRRATNAAGFRFRLHRRDLLGTPNLVFPRLLGIPGQRRRPLSVKQKRRRTAPPSWVDVIPAAEPLSPSTAAPQISPRVRLVGCASERRRTPNDRSGCDDTRSQTRPSCPRLLRLRVSLDAGRDL